MKSPFDAIARRWRSWKDARHSVAALDCCGTEGTELLAHDVGVSVAELRALAGKWPETPDLLARRLAALGLEEDIIGGREPAVLRDLQRVCTLCSSTDDCKQDLARNQFDPVWHVYCPNAVTLEALASGRARKGPAQCAKVNK